MEALTTRHVKRSLALRLAAGLTLATTLSAAGSVLAFDPADAASSPTQVNRVVLANEILNRWEPIAVQAGVHSPAWREMFATQLAAMDVSILLGIDRLNASPTDDGKTNYAPFAQAMRSAEMQSYMLAQSGKGHMKLGSASTDQVFIPIVPCRIVDTRNVGGPISAGQARNFFFYSNAFRYNWSSQGGVNGFAGLTCPGTLNPNGGAPSAAVVTVTVVSPSAAGNWIIWGGANPVPTASALNWTGPGQILANTTVIPAGGRTGTGPGGAVQDFAVEYNGPSGSAQFIADVVGYLVENQATALDCYETPLASAPLSGGGYYNGVNANACSPGWALTAGNCDRDSDSAYLFAEYYVTNPPPNQWSCYYFSSAGSSGTHNIYASSICCRLPGR